MRTPQHSSCAAGCRYLFPAAVDRNGALVAQGLSTAAAAAASSGEVAGQGMLGAASGKLSNQSSLRVCSNELYDVCEAGTSLNSCYHTVQLQAGTGEEEGHKGAGGDGVEGMHLAGVDNAAAAAAAQPAEEQ